MWFRMQPSIYTILMCDLYMKALQHSICMAVLIRHFTFECSVTLPMNVSEVGGDFALIQTSLLFSLKYQLKTI